MVKIGILDETKFKANEARVAITPLEAKRLLKNPVFELLIEKGAGNQCLLNDDDYEQVNCSILSTKQVLDQADLIAFVSTPPSKILPSLSDKFIIAPFNSFVNPKIASELEKNNITAIALERIPRTISACQTMDTLSSQTSIIGYKAAILAANYLPKFFPMLSTAAGTVKPAKVLVMGAGVAGLQAIATAKRLGAQVSAFDVRAAAKEEIASLGAKFLELSLSFSVESADGYARELSPEESKEQQKALDEAIANFDCVITTAMVPGKKPPQLFAKDAVDKMPTGSVVIDCAASDLGGNIAESKPGETHVTKKGITIVGADNLASKLPISASNLYARNICETIKHFLRDDRLQVDKQNEVDQAMVISC